MHSPNLEVHVRDITLVFILLVYFTPLSQHFCSPRKHWLKYTCHNPLYQHRAGEMKMWYCKNKTISNKAKALPFLIIWPWKRPPCESMSYLYRKNKILTKYEPYFYHIYVCQTRIISIKYIVKYIADVMTGFNIFYFLLHFYI